ncbi:MAG TPA: 2-hydroxyglutaryl-CoA dehydratase [Firmicutes bacterium]|nr:2-hydroxyglutaryl-CoA dehydratase [Bacillota bacterium]
MRLYLGIDVGSVSTDLALVDEARRVVAGVYLRTRGRPIEAVQAGLAEIERALPSGSKICGVGTTGSGRYLAGAVVGSDVIKNEITAHAVAAMDFLPGVQTVIEIGGQDSKMIIIRNGVVADFGMNTMCAAGTGSFLDQQSARLGIPIEEFGDIALQSKSPVRVAGRCTVFAESDMIHKQQMGCRIEDILYGLCQALVRNYLNNVGKGKRVLPPVVFQGGVAANKAMKRAFEEHLGMEIFVPENHGIMGAIGAAILAAEAVGQGVTRFAGFRVAEAHFETSGFECQACPNCCEIVELRKESRLVARWGGRCGRWERFSESEAFPAS